MRTTPYPPDKMLPNVQALYEDMAKEVAQNLKGTISIPSNSGREF